jgi:hypothetical protein
MREEQLCTSTREKTTQQRARKKKGHLKRK